MPSWGKALMDLASAIPSGASSGNMPARTPSFAPPQGQYQNDEPEILKTLRGFESEYQDRASRVTGKRGWSGFLRSALEGVSRASQASPDDFLGQLIGGVAGAGVASLPGKRFDAARAENDKKQLYGELFQQYKPKFEFAQQVDEIKDKAALRRQQSIRNEIERLGKEAYVRDVASQDRNRQFTRDFKERQLGINTRMKEETLSQGRQELELRAKEAEARGENQKAAEMRRNFDSNLEVLKLRAKTIEAQATASKKSELNELYGRQVRESNDWESASDDARKQMLRDAEKRAEDDAEYFGATRGLLFINEGIGSLSKELGEEKPASPRPAPTSRQGGSRTSGSKAGSSTKVPSRSGVLDAIRKKLE